MNKKSFRKMMGKLGFNRQPFSINDGLTNIERYKLRHGGLNNETEKARQIDKASYSANIKAKG